MQPVKIDDDLEIGDVFTKSKRRTCKYIHYDTIQIYEPNTARKRHTSIVGVRRRRLGHLEWTSKRVENDADQGPAHSYAN